MRALPVRRHSPGVWSHITPTEGVLMESQFIISQGAVEAYEKASGFQGIGRFFEERGLLKIRKEESREEST